MAIHRRLHSVVSNRCELFLLRECSFDNELRERVLLEVGRFFARAARNPTGIELGRLEVRGYSKSKISKEV